MIRILYASVLFLLALATGVSDARAQSCTSNSQCPDLPGDCQQSFCRRPIPYLPGSCDSRDVADGTLCTLSGYPNATCQSGACTSTEWCDDGLDNDGNGLTDEHVPWVNDSCEGPIGVNEFGDWYIGVSGGGLCNGAGPQMDGPVADGEPCHYHGQCYSSWCVDRVNAHAICAPTNGCPLGWPHSGWGRALAITSCPPTLGMDYMCVPFNTTWTDPRAGAGNNLFNESCRFNSDCASDLCVRANDVGRCVSTCPQGGSCPSGSSCALAGTVDPFSVCVPNTHTCTQYMETGCVCNPDGTWDC